jgi:hypothetical protein
VRPPGCSRLAERQDCIVIIEFECHIGRASA